MIRVFIADDHVIVRDGISRVIADNDDMELAGQAANTETLLKSLAQEAWDVLVLDLNMPGSQGLATVEKVCEQWADKPVVVFSMHGENSYAVSAMRAGARAFLSKDRAPSELVSAIRKVFEGGLFVTPDLAEYVMRTGIDLNRQPHESFSSREHEVFLRLARGAKPSEIARQLNLGSSTVTTYVHRIKQKLGVHSLGEIIRYAHQQGLAD